MTTTKLEQAARQALEALDILLTEPMAKTAADKAEALLLQAAPALREALEHPVKLAISEEAFNWIDANAPMFVREALAGVNTSPTEQAEQERMFKVGNLVTVNSDPYPALGHLFVQLWDGDDLIARVYADDEQTLHKRVSALNTAPVRTVDLTDDEIYSVVANLGFAQLSPIEVARAVIAADREKNK